MARRLPRTNATRNGLAASSQGAAASSTLTYSTRFDDRQRELINQAAKLKQWSPAKLIREAAISRAADIVNASGSSLPTLRRLARLVAEQLVAPACLVVSRFGTGDTGEEEKLPEVDLADGENCVVAYRPEPADQYQIQAALETCGESFIQMILEAWQAYETGSGVYKPKVFLGDLSDETAQREEASPRDT